ncbi:hypothetical protein LCM20_01675 [Halobacillus litoralis]|uniref:hypothetical protein n=1 Tax=Halobacillus litoralis TaxID=45668 RepID=UPI001CD72145|nr:hypothetical protein [Halobacillus litoralis]MCA0969296.1 hypothetical protein [Halobacillus litoralis]
MNAIREMIDQYGENVKNAELSSFECLNMLQDRTEIFKRRDELTKVEQIHLAKVDLQFVEQVDAFLEKIEEVYDFTLSDEHEIPAEQWWWHLNKLSMGHLDFGIFVQPKQVI